MAQLRAGKSDALGSLFETHSAAVFGYFYRLTRPAGIADDLTQEVFLRVLRYHASFKPGNSFRVWLFGIARNVLADHRARRIKQETEEAIELDSLTMPSVQFDRVASRETRERVRAALDRLNDADRELLVLSRFHELKPAELADLYDCKVGAIKVRIHRALKRLATEIHR